MENKYKYKYIVIYPGSSNNNIEIQKMLFGFGIVWYSQKDSNDTPFIMYQNLNDIVLHINLLEKYITKTDHLSQYIIQKDRSYQKDENYDPQIYEFKDIDNIKSIILYGVKKPIYQPKNKIKRVFESFDSNKSIIINVHNIHEYNIIKNDLDKWRLKCDNYEENISIGEESDLYPINFLIDVIPYNIYTIHPYDPWVNLDDYDWDDYNVYDSINDFYNDKNALSYVKNNGINIPNYDPKYKPIREEYFYDFNPICIYCKNRQESVELEQYLHQNGFVYNDGEKYYISNNSSYNTDMTLIINRIQNKSFFASKGKYSKDGNLIYYSICKYGIKRFISNPNSDNLNKITSNEPTYEPRKKIIRENINFDKISIYCKNREESVEFEDFLHQNGFVYNDGEKYYISNNTYYNNITFILNNHDNNPDNKFNAYRNKYNINNSLFLEYEDFKDKIKTFILNPSNHTYKELSMKTPDYKPKSKIIREFKIFEGKFHDNYPYETIVIQLNDEYDLEKLKNYITNTLNMIVDYGDYMDLKNELNRNSKKYFRFCYNSTYNRLYYKYGNLSNININLDKNEFEKIYTVDDLLNDLIQKISMTGEYKIIPDYNPKLKNKRSLD